MAEVDAGKSGGGGGAVEVRQRRDVLGPELGGGGRVHVRGMVQAVHARQPVVDAFCIRPDTTPGTIIRRAMGPSIANTATTTSQWPALAICMCAAGSCSALETLHTFGTAP